MPGLRWNDAEVARLLESREGPVGRDLLTKAATVARRAKELCPVSPHGSGGNPSGHLRNSIEYGVGRDERGLYGEAGTDVEYALPVELGSRPHVIESHGDYPLRNPATGQVFGKRVQHPGTEAQPFLRPALDSIRGT